MVTCLCLTPTHPAVGPGKSEFEQFVMRRKWLPHAIDCFLNETYADRELLIVPDERGFIEDLIPPDPRIRVVYSGGAMKIGEKRNFGCAAAAGQFIAHWDDDDHSEPGRLALEIETLDRAQKSVTGFHSMKFTDGDRWWLYRGAQAFALGTSLCYRKSWWERNRFDPTKQIGEDSHLVSMALAQREFISLPDTDLMYATVHESNTSPRSINNRGAWIPQDGFCWQSKACAAVGS